MTVVPFIIVTKVTEGTNYEAHCGITIGSCLIYVFMGGGANVLHMRSSVG